MGFLKRFGASPTLGFARHLANPRPDLLSWTHLQFASSDRGMPMARIDLGFKRNEGGASNPEMTLAVLLDRSGSMTGAFDDGHVETALGAIQSYVGAAGAGFDLIMYDDEATDVGHIANWSDLQTALGQHRPRGRGTYVRGALEQTVQHHHTRRGIYIIVITDGEFADKTEVQHYIVETLLPKLTPENPYAFRLHFVGAGVEVDRVFLEQLEAAASGKSAIQMVKHHHHAHLQHSHGSMLEELDRAFIGPGLDVMVGERPAPSGDQHAVISRVGDLQIGRWQDGALVSLGFVPRRVQLGLEFDPQHPESVETIIRYRDARFQTVEIPFQVPLPRVTAQPGAAQAATPRRGLHLPWRHQTPEEQAAKEAAAQERAALALRIQQVRQAERERQTLDLQLLGQGRIPSTAQQRLAELHGADPEHSTFTSDLSPDEAALLRRNGYRPLGLVCGSAMYHVGIAYASSYQDCEVTVLSQAYNTATRLAVDRMEQEAVALGAHGVVGVRFDIVRHEWSEKTIEVQLVGTAIAGPGRAPEVPWLSDLSGQEWFALHRAGYDPVGLVYGNCTWFVLTTQMDEWSERSFSNQELGHFSDALKQCRDRVNSQVRASAQRLKAVGVVGVHLTRRLDEIRLTGPGMNPAYEREHHNLSLNMVGTAVRLRPDAPKTIRATTNVLSLRDGRIKPMVIRTTAAKFE